jgi:acyl-CoA reductase-like NAD-dependent aldehyde dehydrogenase
MQKQQRKLTEENRGGNDPAIICKSVDIKTVAPKIATLNFLNSGQICLCVKRVYIHKDIYNEFRDAMVEYTKTLKVGDGTEDGVFLGPIQNSMQYEKVKGFFDDVEKSGAKIAVGGKVSESGGYFIHPTIIDSPDENSKIVQEEPFGMSPFPPKRTFVGQDFSADVRSRTHRTHHVLV